MKTRIKKAFKLATDFRYHRIHINQAIGILRNIERETGELSAHDRRLCDHYAIDILGHRYYAPWLYVYSAVSREFRFGWIPDNYYGAVVVPAIQGSYGRTSFLRGLNTAFFHSDLFPDLATYANGIFFNSRYGHISYKDIKTFLFCGRSQVVFKADNSYQGRGLHVMTPDTFTIELLRGIGNGTFQQSIVQHPLLERFADNSVATLRLTTVYEDNGEISLRAAYLRLGSGRDTHVQSSSHIRVSIDQKTGEFSAVGYTPEWTTIDKHPYSLQVFAGCHVPNFRSAINEVKALHKMAPFVRCIGWDVAIDCNGNPKLMEWNGVHNDIKFSEATQGPCFSDLGWVEPAFNHDIRSCQTCQTKAGIALPKPEINRN